MAKTKTPVKPEPMGPKEVAEFLGVKRATVQQWSYRDVLPAPDFTIGKTPVWQPDTIIRWAVETGRLSPDDPRAQLWTGLEEWLGRTSE